jgi:Ca2+-dependent lipid-binding protein
MEGKKGELNFSLRYCFEKNALQVSIASATNLSTSGGALLDPYVKLQLLPEKQHKVKTRVVRNTLCPVYDEDFTFYGLNYNQLQSTTLHFVVVAFDRYSRDEILGEVICPLNTVDLSDSDRQASLSMELMSRSLKFQNSQHRGEILTSLCYQPATNKVTVVVLKAKNLPKFDITGLADPYAKVYMLYNGQKLAKKKTHVKKRTLTPVYNESFVFDLPTSDPGALEQISFEFLVMDWDRVTKNEVMGRAVIGCETRSASGRAHWDQVRRNPRRQFAEWHRLRP